MAMALVTTSRLSVGTPWRSANSRATAALRTVKSTCGAGLGSPVSWNIAARYSSSRSKGDPASCGDGGGPGVRTMGVVAQHRCEELLGGLLRVSGQRRVRGREARRLDGGAASRMHAQGRRQQAGDDAELFAQQRPGQRHALAGGEHAAGALGPSDRPERVPGASTAAATGGGGRGHRSILGAGRPGAPKIKVVVQGRRPAEVQLTPWGY